MLSIRSIALFSAALVALPTSSAIAQLTATPQFFQVDPTATYLRTGLFDGPALPTIIYLGVTGPTTIRLVATGDYSVAGPTQSGKFWALFSASNTLLPTNDQLNRVPGAIDLSGPDITEAVTGPSLYDQLPMDIPQDFYVPPGSSTYAVPDGAQYLFLGIPDSYLADNSTPNRSALGVYASVESVVPEPETWMLTCVGAGAMLLRSRLRKRGSADDATTRTGRE